MKNNIQNKGEIIIYQTSKKEVKLKVRFKNETVWLNQAQIVKLFNKDQSVISRHIKNIFKDGEVDEKSNMQNMHIANSDKPVIFYSLDIILAVVYRTGELIKDSTCSILEQVAKGRKRHFNKTCYQFVE